MHIRSVTVTILALFFATGSLPAQDRERELLDKVDVKRNLVYRTIEDLNLHVDVYRPKDSADKKLPVVVWIHGGGWQNGSKNGGYGRLLPLVSTGKYAGVSVQYRLTDVASWPAQIHDCKAAIRWIRANAAEHGFDKDKIGVWGSSAGGHLVSMLGTSGDVKQLEGPGPHLDQSSQVTCVVDFCGPSDFLLFANPDGRRRKPTSPIDKLLGGLLEDKLDLAKEASPATHATANDPPFLIVHGTNDRVVPLSQAEHFHEVLTKANCKVELLKVEGGGHGIRGAEVDARVKSFLAEHLLGDSR